MYHISDFHSHHQRLNAIVAREPGFIPQPNHCYSVGVHPWNLDRCSSTPSADYLINHIATLIEQGKEDNFIIGSIGETGLDFHHNKINTHLQKQWLIAHIEASETLHLGLTLHCVKAYNVILELHKQLKPHEPWVIHGFRGKPQLARMLTDHGIMLSIGPLFNNESVKIIDSNMLMIETDYSTIDIYEVARRVATIRQCDTIDIINTSSTNIHRFLTKNI